MKVTRWTLISITVALLLSLTLSASAQWDKKSYTEWSEKDAEKVLNNSPWAKTQTFSSPVTLFRGPSGGQGGQPGGPTSGSNTANATHIHFRVRFLSAKPVRLAVSRMLELKQKGEMNEQLAAHLKAFTSGDFVEYIVVTVSAESTDTGANVQEAQSVLRTRGTAQLKNNTFLEVKGGKRLFLHEYQPPRPDGLGARFLFTRNVDGKAFITPESEEIRFVAELSDNYRLDRRYKTKEMMYEGKLEY
jgi:hypothetical protein